MHKQRLEQRLKISQMSEEKQIALSADENQSMSDRIFAHSCIQGWDEAKEQAAEAKRIKAEADAARS
jgi:hypothetical protein